ncbi:unnamed protein product [Prunus armeniaca]|uniref:X8 domain-containing protein n=1 Tax=Prunus armeniaca TaxID=36596 RepID=A0A6J5UFR6_PRUAR|nr:unnamed protein product [Prunus armeniaca]
MAALSLFNEMWQPLQSNIFLLPLLLLSAYILLSLTRSSSSGKNYKLPPSPPTLPLIGNLHQLEKFPHRSLRDLSKKYARVEECAELAHPPPQFLPLEVSPPFSFPPFDSLAPLPLPGNVPLSPNCANPPFSQNPPQPNTPSSSSSPSSSAPTCSPIPKPPPANEPTPHPPGPPTTIPSPPKNPPSPPKPVPGPPALAPPVAYPPPSGPTSPPQQKPPQSGAVWCVAKPAVPGPIVQEALDYACGSGADCKSIQPNGSCYKPDTLLSHASYAFNSYWQSTRAAGGTCDFGGTAMIVTVDPSFDGCHFFYNG